MSAQSVPTEVNFTNADVTRMMRRPQLREGWMKFRVVAVKDNAHYDSGTMYQTLVVSPLNESGNIARATLQHRIALPFANADVADHKAPNTIGFCESYLQATNPVEFKRYPKKNGNVYVTADGVTLDFKEKERAVFEMKTAILTEMRARWADPQKYLGEEFFGKVQYKASPGSDTKWPNLVKIFAEEPGDAEVFYDDFMQVDSED